MNAKRKILIWATVVVACCTTAAAISVEPKTARKYARQNLAEPKVLLYSTINEWWLKDTMDRWANSGYGGFIITSYVQWFTSRAELETHRVHFSDLVRGGMKYGITDNFIDVQLAATKYDDGGTLPAWQDEAGWKSVLTENFPAIGEFAKTSGLKGIALDTEPYAANLWKLADPRYGGRSKAELQKLVFDKGRRLMTVLQEAYPGIQIILLQEGSFWWVAQSDANYELWPSFYNGMASTQPTPGIIIGTESTYPEDVLLGSLKRNPEAFTRNRAAAIQASMYSVADLPEYWKAKGSLAIGMWPLGVSYSDKSARYASAVFEAQMDAAKAVSEKYVWVYGHGNAWWQMTQREVVAYSEAPWHYTFDKASQILPTDPNAQAYFAVVRGSSRTSPASP